MRILFALILVLISNPDADSSTQDVDNTGDGTLRRIHVPILMYHYIEDLPADADEIRTDLTVSPALFKDHLSYLAENGYETISFGDLHKALYYGAALPSKPVILTFDDGYDNHYTQAYPSLSEFGFTGTFFVITGFLDEQRQGYMTWQQAKEMADAGMTIASHTKTHPDLRQRSYEYLTYQILGSMESIAAHTGTSPVVFSYPVGRYDQAVLDVVAQTSLWFAVTTQAGSLITTDNPFEMPRVRIHNTTSTAALARLLQQPR